MLKVVTLIYTSNQEQETLGQSFTLCITDIFLCAKQFHLDLKPYLFSDCVFSHFIHTVIQISVMLTEGFLFSFLLHINVLEKKSFFNPQLF